MYWQHLRKKQHPPSLFHLGDLSSIRNPDASISIATSIALLDQCPSLGTAPIRLAPQLLYCQLISYWLRELVETFKTNSRNQNKQLCIERFFDSTTPKQYTFKPDRRRPILLPTLYNSYYCKTSKFDAQLEAGQKMFVAGKYRIFVGLFLYNYFAFYYKIQIMLGPKDSRTRKIPAFSKKQRFNSGPNI